MFVTGQRVILVTPDLNVANSVFQIPNVFLIVSFKVEPLGLYLLKHLFYLVRRGSFLVKLSTDLHFLCFPMELRTIDVCEE